MLELVNSEQLLEDARYMRILINNNEYASVYLKQSFYESLKNNDCSPLVNALRRIVIANIGYVELAKRTGINKSSIYKSLSPDANPRLETLLSIVHAIDLSVTVPSSDPRRLRPGSVNLL